MPKKILFYSFLFFQSLHTIAQPLCGFDNIHQNLLKKNGTYAANVDSNEEKIRKYIKAHPQIKNSPNAIQSTLYTIPVVVHVMNTGGVVGSLYNPNDDQIKGAIDYLNQVYRGSYPGTTGAGDLYIQFELVKRTQNNSCTNGIDRVDASSLPGYVANGVNVNNTNGCPELTLKDFARWHTYEYYNIWIVNKIDGKDGIIGQYIAGFAWLPGVSPSLDGTVILATQIMPGQKTLPHEIGHALNLYHTFEGSANNTDCPFNFFCSIQGDRVCDTDPITENASGGIIDPACRTGTNPCTKTSYNDNTEKNYMSYTNCYNLFTNGQKDRLRAAMSLSSRTNLVSPENLALIPFTADLTIINPQLSPTTITAGNTVTVSFRENNSGFSTAENNYVNFHLSQNNVLTPGLNGDIYLDQYYVNQTVAPRSQTILFSKQLTIPSSTQSGKYYIFFAADGTGIVNECDDNNNFATAIINVIGTPICTAPAIARHPTTKTIIAPTGTSFNISATGSNNSYQWQVNTGSGWSELFNSSTYSGVYTTFLNIISTTAGMNNHQYRCKVSSSCTVSTATSNAATLTVNISSTGCNNDVACTSRSIAITSSCLGTSCTTIGATPPIPNISFNSCLGVPYQTGRYDDDVWFTITPSNSSQVTIKVTPTSNLINFDPVIGMYSNNCSSPTQFNGGCADLNGNGGTEQLLFTPTSGTTYLIRVFGYGIGSAYSGNFDICVTQPGQPNPITDLVVTNPQLSVNSLCAGGDFNISFEIQNKGNATASPTTVKYYLSSNDTYSSNDEQIGANSINTIAGNGVYSISSNLSIPSGTSSGTKHILIMADANKDINEGSNGEANNVSASQIEITPCGGAADLSMDYISHSPLTINPGIQINVNYGAKNTGGVKAPINKIGIYISTDTDFDPLNDEFVRDWTQTSLDPDENHIDLLGFKIPNCYPCGNYYIFLVVDYLDIIPETDNNNNHDYFPIQITGCVSCAYSVPSTGINFQSSGGSGNLNITTTQCCPWTATTSDSWITILNSSGSGNGVVNYTVSPCNGGTSRTGTITVAGQLHTITQNCTEICNASQSFEWAVKAGSSTLSDNAEDLAIDASGNLYMTGDIQGSADFGSGIILTTPSTAPDIFVSKHNSSGQIQWAIRYGTTTQEAGSGIVTDKDGNIYVIGSFGTSITFDNITLNSINGAGFLLKLNPSGNVQWATKINDYTYANNIVIDNNSSLYITGSYSNGGDGLFIAKYNTSGTQIWYNNYGVGFYSKTAFGMAVDYSGNIFICGQYMNTITLGAFTLNATNDDLDIDGFTAKVDAVGNVIWAQKLTSPGRGTDQLRSIVVDAGNNIYVSGNVDSTAIIGNITIPLSSSSKEIIIKYDQNGNPLWAKASVSGSQYNKQEMVKGNDNDIYICGDFYSSIQIDSFAIVGAGNNDAYIIRIAENGEIKWMKGFGGPQSESARSIVTNVTNDIFVAGGFYGSVPFGSTLLTSFGSEDIYLSKFKQCDPPIANITYNGKLVLCPGQKLDLSTSYCSKNSYQWFLNDLEIPGANKPTYTASEPGLYKVKVVAFEGCETISDPISIEAHPAPTVVLTSPDNNSTYTAPATLTLNATASDPDGIINSVQFYNGSTLLNDDSTSPYSFTINKLAAGNYSLLAKAIACNVASNSATVAISVLVPQNKAPVVEITDPLNNVTLIAPASITVNATASDPDGTITNVKFFNGATLLVIDSTSPYSYTLNNAVAGTYKFYAQATENKGLKNSSSTITAFVIAPSANKAPTVSITSPVNNATYPETETIVLDATASDPDGTIISVMFYNGSLLLKTDSSSPYSCTVSQPPTGNYTFVAKAIDNKGLTNNSATVTVRVPGTVNKAPTVNLTVPVNNATYLKGANITLNAIASDEDGTIISVQFYNGGTLLKSDSTAPYSHTINNVKLGSYKFYAKTKDNNGLSNSSSTVSVFVVAGPSNKAPSVKLINPGNNENYSAPGTIFMSATASDEDGTIANVKFYRGSTLLTTDSIPPYSYTLTNLPIGKYSFVAKATDNNGLDGNSATVAVSVSLLSNKAPLVNITSPDNNTDYTAPSTITLNATASDDDGSITSIKFYNDSALLSIDSISPYSYTLNNVAIGKYRFYAKATDNKNLTNLSATSTVMVRAGANNAFAMSTAVNESKIRSWLFSENNKSGIVEAAKLKLVPNPAHNILNIYTTGLQPNKHMIVSIISSSGVVIKTMQLISSVQTLQLNVSSLVTGMYIIKVISGNTVIHGQFIKL